MLIGGWTPKNTVVINVWQYKTETESNNVAWGKRSRSSPAASNLQDTSIFYDSCSEQYNIRQTS